ncbi:MAG: MATE family efflux transporter [Candidatus Marinimicrobia bacterium]|nr:MATE family efflux transporter [Candidatus Neomarinimicrobiota bacterium]
MFSKLINLLKPKDKSISNQVIRLALPAIVGNLSRVLMSVVDVAMVGRLGTAALAATGMGAMLFWGALSLVLGIRTSTQTIASRRLGQKIYNECSTALHNGILLAAIYSIPVSVAGYYFTEEIIHFFIEDAVAATLCITYSRIVFIGLFFSSLSFVFQGYFTGIEKTRIHMRVSVTSNIMNVYLNVGLIYGTEKVIKFFDAYPYISWVGKLWAWIDFPALGVQGAAIATLIASVWLTAHYCYYLFSEEQRKKYKTMSLTVNKKMMIRQIRLALPQGSQEMAVAIGWAMYYKIMGMIGLIELATTELVFTIMHASFMPAIGVGQAGATLVGKFMGERRLDKAETSIYESIRWAEIIMGSVGILFFLFPKVILSIFTNDPSVIHYGTFGLRVLGLIQFVDAIAMTLWFTLSGAGNTFFPAVVESSLVWFFLLPASFYLGIVLNFGFYGPWLMFPLYLIFFAIILWWKLKKGDWKHIEV